MKNRCIHTEKVMKEYHYAVMLDYYRKLIIPFLILYLLMIINFVMRFMKHDIGALTIFNVAAPVFLAGVLIAKLENVIRLNRRRMQVMYGKSDCECMVEFKDFILMLEGRMFIPLDKSGFIEGDVESFRKFIDGKIKK